MYNKSVKLITVVCLVSALVACGSVDSQAVFTSSAPRDTPNLATPPGMNSPDLSATYKMNQPAQMQTGYQLNNVQGMNIVSGGSQRWLVMESTTVNNVWPMLLAYVNQIGLTVKYQNTAIGVLQTDWASRNTAVPQGASLRGLFDWIGWGSMYSLNSMYMYRITMWQDGKNVVVMDTNYQMDEEYQGCSSPGLANTSSRASSDQQQTKWVARGSNPQLELEFLAQFMSFAGMPAEEAKKVVAAAVKEAPKNAVVQNGQVVVNDTFDRTWWRTAIALDRVGLGVADKNRSNGEYDVYPLKASVDNPDPGFMEKMFSNESAAISNDIKPVYMVKIVAQGTQTIINLNMYGNVSPSPDFAAQKQKYLTGIADQLQ